LILLLKVGRMVSIIGTLTGLRAGGPKNRCSITYCGILHSVQTGYESNLATYYIHFVLRD